MKILAIETSCDETAASVASLTGETITIISNIVASQIDIHQAFGGVVPEVAAREHVKQILPTIDQALKQAGLDRQTAKEQLDGIAVTQGPGLLTSLLVGVETAKSLALAWQLPLIPVQHIAGHVSANFINRPLSSFSFPTLTLTVSGGHTALILMKDQSSYQIIGQTLDDAAGEAFDKAASLLKLGYPGGPKISAAAAEFAKNSSSSDIKLPAPMLRRADYNFSFSGLKTALLYAIQKDPNWANRVSEYAYVFEQAVVEALIRKTIKAASELRVKSIMLAGGVAANRTLRDKLAKTIEQKLPGVTFTMPELIYTTDNAAMIAAAGLINLKNKKTVAPDSIIAQPNLSI
ncbi:MAG TPA: tRNA (adenosine(37)-N6)-threonylcarbamoyltransferase complex transferase subunit TsaD [bacterium]|nr:tRNA (adenosine(37)-N6)-threonylcarbamoyltransferase complex transferase subunit TsaD [bacterium]